MVEDKPQLLRGVQTAAGVGGGRKKRRALHVVEDKLQLVYGERALYGRFYTSLWS